MPDLRRSWGSQSDGRLPQIPLNTESTALPVTPVCFSEESWRGVGVSTADLMALSADLPELQSENEALKLMLAEGAVREKAEERMCVKALKLARTAIVAAKDNKVGGKPGKERVHHLLIASGLPQTAQAVIKKIHSEALHLSREAQEKSAGAELQRELDRVQMKLEFAESESAVAKDLARQAKEEEKSKTEKFFRWQKKLHRDMQAQLDQWRDEANKVKKREKIVAEKQQQAAREVAEANHRAAEAQHAMTSIREEAQAAMEKLSAYEAEVATLKAQLQTAEDKLAATQAKGKKKGKGKGAVEVDPEEKITQLADELQATKAAAAEAAEEAARQRQSVAALETEVSKVTHTFVEAMVYHIVDNVAEVCYTRHQVLGVADEARERQLDLIRGLVDRGVVSYQSAAELESQCWELERGAVDGHTPFAARRAVTRELLLERELLEAEKQRVLAAQKAQHHDRRLLAATLQAHAEAKAEVRHQREAVLTLEIQSAQFARRLEETMAMNMEDAAGMALRAFGQVAALSTNQEEMLEIRMAQLEQDFQRKESVLRDQVERSEREKRALEDDVKILEHRLGSTGTVAAQLRRELDAAKRSREQHQCAAEDARAHLESRIREQGVKISTLEQELDFRNVALAEAHKTIENLRADIAHIVEELRATEDRALETERLALEQTLEAEERAWKIRLDVERKLNVSVRELEERLMQETEVVLRTIQQQRIDAENICIEQLEDAEVTMLLDKVKSQRGLRAAAAATEDRLLEEVRDRDLKLNERVELMAQLREALAVSGATNAGQRDRIRALEKQVEVLVASFESLPDKFKLVQQFDEFNTNIMEIHQSHARLDFLRLADEHAENAAREQAAREKILDDLEATGKSVRFSSPSPAAR
mmetsp:Transcript_76256/g.203924  ORF Transcript_76256/g.203924 Transcript_76256/m.203924 type:complete len:883 (+) Transcript_76256:32-2680(+)